MDQQEDTPCYQTNLPLFQIIFNLLHPAQISHIHNMWKQYDIIIQSVEFTSNSDIVICKS
jgi:hypothetical protein